MCIVMDKLDGGDLVEGLQRHLKVPPIFGEKMAQGHWPQGRNGWRKMRKSEDLQVLASFLGGFLWFPGQRTIPGGNAFMFADQEEL